MTTASLTLAVSANGNWSLTPEHVPNDFPPMAFPDTLNTVTAQKYALSLLHTANVPAPAELTWIEIGYTVVNNHSEPAYRARWDVPAALVHVTFVQRVETMGKSGTTRTAHNARCSCGWHQLKGNATLAEARAAAAEHAPGDNWVPEYSPWRHGGWYVDNVSYPSKAIGCVSRNYADKQWRIVCDTRPFETAPTFPSRDDAARAEFALAQS